VGHRWGRSGRTGPPSAESIEPPKQMQLRGVHAIVPPLSLCGPVLNVRKFSSIPIGPAELLANGSLGFRMLGFLAACVRGRLNVVISGGTSSGKTTLLGVLSSFVPQEERLITIEDAAELRLAQPHVIGLEARQATVGVQDDGVEINH
jgi:pilus assembly protein CpaF